MFDHGSTPLVRVTYDPGWHWYDDWRQPLGAGDLCMNRHAGIVVSGHLHLELEDGSTMDWVAGDAYDIPPGHDGWVVGDEAWVAIDSEAHRLFGSLDPD